MYFFDQTSTTITQATQIGSWNVAGYQQINLHALVTGAPGTVWMGVSFNNLDAVEERLTISAPPGGLGFAILTRTYPVCAPTLSVIVNSSVQIDFRMQLYAACCEPQQSGLTRAFSRLARLFGGSAAAADGEAYRRLGRDVAIDDSLRRAPDQPASEGQ
jgi:hypothetical protein